jgi:hypothetical protein
MPARGKLDSNENASKEAIHEEALYENSKNATQSKARRLCMNYEQPARV